MTSNLSVLFILVLATLIVADNLHAAQEHPFLICKRSQFPELRQRAEHEPWATMKADAYVVIENEYNATDPVELHRYIGAATLVYILEENNAAANAKRVYDAVMNLEQIEFDPSKRWAGTVRQMGVSFVCILALDIIQDDLSITDITRCEALIERKINQIERTGSWAAARYGTHGTWDIYKGLRTTPDDAFYANYVRQMTDDGVSTVSPGYSFARLGSGDDRLQKTGYADVLEFTGIDNRYYSNERLQRYYRWLFSACTTPAREYHMFGDVSPRWGSPNGMLLWRVGRFDQQAAAYAAWMLKDKKPAGHFIIYILMTEPLPEPVVPQSQLFMTGAAVFREQTDSPMSLGGMLYNIDGNDEWHTHEEANGISLAAYGNRLLTNGGWLGEPMFYAERNNTITINGQRHAKRHGNGLLEGLLGDGLDYACGDSGEALDDGKTFHRSLLLIHGQEDVGGYFAVIDEVAAQANDQIHSYLQLASESPVVSVSDRQEYQAEIDHHANAEGVKLSVYYATKPASVEMSLIESGSLKRDPQAGHHYRMEAIYPTDDNGRAQVLTVLFPHDGEHLKAALSAMSQPDVNGVTVSYENGIEDWIVTANDEYSVKLEGMSFQAKAAMVRQSHGEPLFYFARQGKSLFFGEMGFECTQPISLHMKGKTGNVISQGAEVTLYHPDAKAVSFNGVSAEIMEKGDGWVRFALPAGRLQINID